MKKIYLRLNRKNKNVDALTIWALLLAFFFAYPLPSQTTANLENARSINSGQKISLQEARQLRQRQVEDYLREKNAFASRRERTPSLKSGAHLLSGNDEAIDAEAIACGQAVAGSNIGATQSAETQYPDNPDVWYTYTPTVTQRITATTCGSANFDTKIEIFDAAFNRLGANDDGAGCDNYTSRVSVLFYAYETYYINVGGHNGDTGDFVLSLSCEDVTVLEGGFTCQTAVPLNCNGSSVIGTTLDAIDPVQSGAPGMAPGGFADLEPQAPGKWYTITVDEDSYVRLNTCKRETNYDTDIEVYEGDPCAEGGANLTPVATSDFAPDFCFNGSYFSADVIFRAEAGVEYKVFVNGFVNAHSGPRQGTYELEVLCSPDPCAIYNCSFVGDFVWEDLDGDGVQDSDEPGFAGVDIRLFNADGTLFDATTSDSEGAYGFSVLPGDYYLVFANVPDHYYSPKDQTTDDKDSDVDFNIATGEGRSDLFSVAYASSNENLDAGLTACPPLSQVGCNDNVNVTLNNDCEALITPDMILEGETYICNKDLIVDVIAPGDVSLGNTVTSEYFGMQLIVSVTDPSTGYYCWGRVTVEDKTAPYFECEPEEIDYVYRAYEVQKASGELRENQAEQINFSDYSCFQDENGSPDNCPEPYDVLEFYVSETDVYTFELWKPLPDGSVRNTDDLHLSLYQGDFNPDEPCSNILVQSNIAHEYGVVEDDQAPEGRFRLSLPLLSDQKYSLLVATEDCGPDPKDKWIVYAFSDGDGLLLDGPITENEIEDLEDNFGDPYELPVKRRLFCSDLDYVLNSAEYVKHPVAFDNCDDEPEVWFKDVLVENGDCGAIYITRTWYIRDASGNEGESCVQTIHFKRPSLYDVEKPPTTVAVECDELTEDLLDENGHPLPALSGYPFVITGFGVVDLAEAYCNIGADYQDISVIDVCENTQKIVRQWIILDWCHVAGQWELNNSEKINWRQILKVGDFSAPEVEDPGDKIYVSTDPFDCEGTLVIPAVEYTDNCSEGVDVGAALYKQNIVDILDQYGRPTGQTRTEYEKVGDFEVGESVDNVLVGHLYKIVYVLTDNCGNTSTEADLFVEVVDDTEPVAVCDDDLHISIGGEGIAKVTAEDVDEGSWDNCELEDVYVSRKLATDDLRDAYLAEVYDLSFDDLVESGLADKDNSSDAVIWVLDEDGDGEWDDEDSENPELFQVLRYKDGMWFTWWREDIKFICADMDTEVTIELLAVDVYYNTNRCWLDVLIEDKIAPYCQAPDDVEIYCTELPYGFDPEDDDQLSDLFGDASGIDNCPGAITRQNGRSVDWNCNAGEIVRSFEAEDVKGLTSTNNCTQTIVVRPVHNYEIKFPKDADADCGVPTPDTIETKEIACDLLSVNVVEERFEASGDACYKIKRTYKVINWCEYDGESPAVEISRDADCDGTTGEEDVYVLVRPDDDYGTITYVDRDNDEENDPSKSPCYDSDVYAVEGHYDNSIVNPYLESTGYWTYAQFIKVYDTTAPEIIIGGDEVFCSLDGVDCEGDVVFPITVTDICAGPDVLVKAFINGEAVAVGGVYPDYTVSGRYELGDYELEIHAVDGCQNSELATKIFRVADCKAPTPICINGLAIELMPTEAGVDADGDGDEDAGAMTIWASDFKVSGLEDCTGEVSISINRAGETPDRDNDNLVLTCDDPDTLAVEIYAWDNADNPTAIQPDGSIGGANYDHCLTYVLVQDNMFNVCDPGPAGIAGLIANEANETVENVQVNLTGGMSNTMITPVDGRYGFSDLTLGGDYTITPIKDNDIMNGVSTFDLVLLTKHILGSKPILSPYKLIAADVNNSNNISALDLIHLRKLILSINSAFPNNTSWRFIPLSYEFPDAANPWFEPFPEVLNYNNLQTLIADGDFIAVKIGDLNDNAVTNSLVSEERNLVGVFHLKTSDQEVVAGNEYRVSFTSEELNVQGYQFTLNHSGLELLDIEFGAAKADNFGVLEDGVITVSWNEDGVFKTPAVSSEAFSLLFRAQQNGRLSDLLSISSRYTRAEAYSAKDELLDVALRFGGQEGSDLQDAFHLEQNTPNPFVATTVIGFNLPKAAEATIKIHDIKGVTLKVIRSEYTRGYHQIQINSNDLPSTGVLYYTLETDEYTATRKMIVIGE